MDESARIKLKELFTTLGFAISEETIREKDNLIQFKLERTGLYCIVSYFDDKPLCEIVFPCPYPQEHQIKRLRELIKNREFLFELQKLVTAPGLFYNFEISDGQFKSFAIFSQIFKKADDIQLSELSKEFVSVFNYGLLGNSFILHKINSDQIPQKQIAENQENLDNPMFS